MKYLKPEMTVLILEAEHVIRTSVTTDDNATTSAPVVTAPGEGGEW